MSKLTEPYYTQYNYETNEIHLKHYVLTGDVQAKIQSGEYITPAELNRIHLQNAEDPMDPRMKSFGPFASKRLKRDLFKKNDFEEKDRYVMGLLPLPDETEEQFSETLFAKCSCDLDRVRAAFVFVSSAQTERLKEKGDESELHAMCRQLKADGNRDLHSELFNKLMQLSAVPYKMITGSVKGAGDRLGFQVNYANTWFACAVQGEWRFIDAYWGSTSLSGFQTAEYSQITADGEIKKAQSSAGQNVFNRNETWFLTDPVEMIRKHFPFESEWQLLARPLTKMEFLQMIFMTEEAMQLPLSLLSHPLNVIPAAAGDLYIQFKELSSKRLRFDTELQIQTKNINEEVRQEVKNSANINGFMSKVIRGGNNTVKLLFKPPCQGKFQLQLEVDGISYLSYIIHCPKASANVQPLPRGDGNLDEFGPSDKLPEIGLEPLDEDGEIRADEGQGTLLIRKIDDKDRRISCRIQGSDGSYLPDNRVIVVSQDVNYSFFFLSPVTGVYAMIVYNYDRAICQYLVESPIAVIDSQMPLPDEKSIKNLGHIQSDHSPSIEILSPNEPYIICNESHMQIQLKFRVPLEIRAELLLVKSDQCQTECEGFSFVNGTRDGANVEIRFALAANYVVNLSAREPGQSGDGQLFYRLFIRALGDIDGTEVQFPELVAGWSYSSIFLNNPMQRDLPPNKSNKFSMNFIDNSLKVGHLVEEKSGKKVDLEVKDGVMTAEINKSSVSRRGSVLLIAGESAESCKPIMKWRFEEDADQIKMEEQIKKAQNNNIKRSVNEVKRQNDMENYELQKKGEPPQSEEVVQEKVKEVKLKQMQSIRSQNLKRLKTELRGLVDEEPLRSARVKHSVSALEKCKPKDKVTKGLIVNSKQSVEAVELITKIDSNISKVAESGKVDGLKSTLCKATSPHFGEKAANRLKPAVREGYRVLLDVGRSQLIPTLKPVLLELASYDVPPEAVHSLVNIIMLVNGEYSEEPPDWRACRSLLKKSADTIGENTGEHIDPDTKAEAQQLLDALDRKKLRKQCSITETLLEWVVAVIGSAQD